MTRWLTLASLLLARTAMAAPPQWLALPPTPILPTPEQSGLAPVNGIKIFSGSHSHFPEENARSPAGGPQFPRNTKLRSNVVRLPLPTAMAAAPLATRWPRRAVTSFSPARYGLTEIENRSVGGSISPLGTIRFPSNPTQSAHSTHAGVPEMTGPVPSI
jgi:hypothetical protein